MRLVTTMPKKQRGRERLVHLYIEDICDEEQLILTRYGHPRIAFVPGGDAVNTMIWSGFRATALLPSEEEAKKHVAGVRDEFRAKVKELKQRWEQEGSDAVVTVTEA